MQSSENQIFELQTELMKKDVLVRELNTTIAEQREYIEKNTFDYSQSLSTIDSRFDGSSQSKQKRRAGGKYSDQKEDFETIENLKDDIKQLLKEYKLIEKQKESVDTKYEDLWKKNEELIREILNMEQVIEDQDHQIVSLRDKLYSQMKEITHNNAVQKHINMMNGQLNSEFDNTETDLNKSANISQQIILENYKAGRIGPRDCKTKKKVDTKALKKALNLSYQIINPKGERLEQSLIEEKIALRKSRGISPFGVAPNRNNLMVKQKNDNSNSTAAEENSKGVEPNKSRGLTRVNSTGNR